MTEFDKKTINDTTETSVSPSPEKSLLSPEDLVKFVKQIESGHVPASPRKPSPKHSRIDDFTVIDEIFEWITETIDEALQFSSRGYADLAVEALLIRPCSADELRTFFLDFSAAYEEMLRIRTGLESPVTADPEDRMHMMFASCRPAWMEERLRRLEALSKTHSLSTDIFRLYEFAGCSVQEISKLTGLPEAKVKVHIFDRRFDIYESKK